MSADVEDFKSAYVRLCTEQRTEVQDSVLRKIAESDKQKPGSGNTLNLSAASLCAKTCAILAKLFETDRSFTDIRFNDCSLSDEGVRAIAYGLSDNRTCRHLELKGNSIRGPAVESLGRCLRQNTTLKSLFLEWNAVGLIETAFAAFCDGLGANSVLTTVDLRSNQISHVGASELANALKRNTALHSLDLRWNSVGLIGGRALLTALDHNKTLIRLQLAGNNIPADVLRSIDTAVARNADRASLTSEHQTRQRVLSKEIQFLNKSHRNELIQLMDKIDRQELDVQQAQRSATEQVCRLQDVLDERRHQYNNVATKLSMTESELTLAESKAKELSHQLAIMKEERAQMTKLHQNELKQQEQERTLLETRLNKELIEANDKNAQLTSKTGELERQCRVLQEQVFDLKESVAHQQSQLKLKQTQFEEQLHFERQKTKEAYKDADNIKAKEVERVRKEAEESDRALMERLHRSELLRLELEEELSRQKVALSNERVLFDERLASAKQRIHTEEDQRRSGLEEKIRVLQASKDELQTYASQQSNLVTELQSRNSQLSIDNESLRRRVTDLQQELAGKNAEMVEEVSRVRIDLNAKVERLENDRRSKEDLYSKIASLEKELADVTSKQRSVLDERDREVQRLTDNIKQRELEIRTMRDADAQRTVVLQSAIQNYCSRSPFSQ